MRNSIAISAISILLLPGAFGQVAFKEKDTLRFAADSSYSRTVIRQNDQLVFGTSKTGVILYDEREGRGVVQIAPSADGEFRDYYSGVGMVSGGNGLLLRDHADDTLLFREGLFFDAMDGRARKAIILADPVNGRFPLFVIDLETQAHTEIAGPEAIGDEACYAASGTTVQWLSDSTIVFVSGGSEAARFHRSDDLGRTWTSTDLPLQRGPGCGPFSVHFFSETGAVAVGGCYTDPQNADKTSVYTSDGGKTWIPSDVMPNGYRSCVTGRKKKLFACGSTGIDYSEDGGDTWQPFDTGNFCALLLEKRTLYATTNKGYCVRYRL